MELSGPNSGDANEDGINDSIQNYVVTLDSYKAQGYVILETPPGTYLSNCQASNNPSPGNAPADINFDFGFFDFTINGLTHGGSTSLTMTLPNGVKPGTYYKYGQTPTIQTDHWYEFMYDEQTGAEINENIIILHFIDALRGDDELIQDSMAIDLGGPGFAIADDDLTPIAVIISPEIDTTITTNESVTFQGTVSSGNPPFDYSWDFDGAADISTVKDPEEVAFKRRGYLHCHIYGN